MLSRGFDFLSSRVILLELPTPPDEGLALLERFLPARSYMKQHPEVVQKLIAELKALTPEQRACFFDALDEEWCRECRDANCSGHCSNDE